jgi:hypothetical protein
MSHAGTTVGSAVKSPGLVYTFKWTGESAGKPMVLYDEGPPGSALEAAMGKKFSVVNTLACETNHSEQAI